MLTPDAYREVYLAAPDGVLVVDHEGIIRDLNPAAELIFGYDRGDLLDQPVERLVPEAFRTAHEAHRARYVSNPHPRPMGAGLDLEGRRRDGSRFPVEISLSTWRREGDAAAFVVCMVRDVTERQRLRDFSRGALRSAEDERKRIARELHDDTAQRLVTLMLRLALLDDMEGDERRAELRVARDQLLETAEGIKRIARGLRPPELEDLGLTTALHAHFRSLRQAAGFEVRSSLDDVDHVLDLDARLVLYRIVQESLNNAVRHSGANEASVSLVLGTDMVNVRIRDEGQGFGKHARFDRTGLGLTGMKERAQMVGGRVTVTSRPGEGTTVDVMLPLETRNVARA